jgi:hypothetical protein
MVRVIFVFGVAIRQYLVCRRFIPSLPGSKKTILEKCAIIYCFLSLQKYSGAFL